MKKTLLFLGTLLVLFAACKKADETPSREDTLIGGNWRRTSIKVRTRIGGVDTTFDVYGALPDCIKDNSLEFKKNFIGAQHLGSSSCTAGEPEQMPFNWQLTNGGTGIQIYNADASFPDVGINATILTLTTNILTIRYQEIAIDPISQVRDTATYTDIFRKG